MIVIKGEGRTISIYFLCVPAFEGPPWFVYLFIYLFFPVLSSLGHHTGEGNESWPHGRRVCCSAVWVGMGKELGLQGHPKP